MGVTLDSNLQYDTHISNLCFKASAQINAMERIGKISKHWLPYCYIQILYFIQFFILSCVLDLLWETKLEKLQERALRLIFSDYTSPYRELQKHGHFLFLSALRIRDLGIEMYKCVHGLNPPYLNELFKSKDTRNHFLVEFDPTLNKDYIILSYLYSYMTTLEPESGISGRDK